ncbi:MAG: hypothetical protein K6T78_10725 [Alicyclobacillus sp.]|nr:hypothetical protein [Alicyclobacillus sp.]
MSTTTCITDIHTHVLPGVDDGPPDLATALNLLAAHTAAGTDRCFCTPHFRSPHFDTPDEALPAAFTALQQAVQSTRDEAGEGLHRAPAFAPGAEVRLSPRLRDVIWDERIPVLGHTHYVLVEFPNNELGADLFALVHELRVRGLQPIMAHPERNIQVQKRTDLVDELTAAGLLLQLTAESLVPERGPAGRPHRTEETAWAILERGRAAVIASDAHDTEWRPPGLLDAYGEISARLGSSVADALIQNANAIWAGEPAQEVAVERRRRRFTLGWRR